MKSDVKLSENFTAWEFKCKCGQCEGWPTPWNYGELVEILEGIRAHFGQPVTITPQRWLSLQILECALRWCDPQSASTWNGGRHPCPKRTAI